MILTTAIEKIRRIKTRKKIIQGGSSSGKTYAILTILIDRCAREGNLSVSVVSESMPHLRRGAVRDFLNIMRNTNRFYDERFNKTSLTYTFGNGSYIEFFSADSPDKLKGARRNILYINECNNVSYEAYQQLSIRTNSEIYLDYNPDRTFWAITEVMLEPDAFRIILNYKDNEALDKSVIEQFEINRRKAETSEYWKNWCKVYIDGEVGSLEGVVFDNWKEIDGIPVDARIVGVGLDFGFTNDPSAAVAVYKLDDKYILDELFYLTGLTNGAINNLLAQHIDKGVEIWADSAEPKSIRELKNYGWKINGVVKGKDSVNWSIGLIQEYNLLVTSESVNLINELQNYQWMKDKSNGGKLNIPIDAFNHAIDAMRYLFMSKGGKRTTGRVPFIIK
jgi:phage terminase large subunit